VRAIAATDLEHAPLEPVEQREPVAILPMVLGGPAKAGVDDIREQRPPHTVALSDRF
jgi:hypothetical protein